MIISLKGFCYSSIHSFIPTSWYSIFITFFSYVIRLFSSVFLIVTIKLYTCRRTELVDLNVTCWRRNPLSKTLSQKYVHEDKVYIFRTIQILQSQVRSRSKSTLENRKQYSAPANWREPSQVRLSKPPIISLIHLLTCCERWRLNFYLTWFFHYIKL